jgi:predicted Zn-ribbon and HTH transcriptional regulator
MAKQRLNVYEQAEKHRAEMGLPEHVAKKRTCLSCGQKFDSEWVGNRMCPECKKAQQMQEESE